VCDDCDVFGFVGSAPIATRERRREFVVVEELERV
jgi:hypothetical protein